jgi:hypothetical protein
VGERGTLCDKILSVAMQRTATVALGVAAIALATWLSFLLCGLNQVALAPARAQELGLQRSQLQRQWEAVQERHELAEQRSDERLKEKEEKREKVAAGSENCPLQAKQTSSTLASLI